MDVVHGVKAYISRMIKESGAGMKVLLMDKETISIVSMVYSQSEILQKEVYLFELLSNPGRESMKHLSAICFVRPTQENIERLTDELKSPKYSSYFVYFSNRLDRPALKTLAEADEHESVREIKEFYGDYIAVAHHLFSLNLEVAGEPGGLWKRAEFLRTCDGLVSLLLALRKRPSIRYTEKSSMTRRLGEEIGKTIHREQELFKFTSDTTPILLILDRRDDPVTPLLNQWSYQAMVHEVLTINNHRVDLSRAPGIKKDLHEVVLSPENDEFFRDNMYLNFGEIGANIKSLVDEYQEKSKGHAKIESIADMKQFIENYPQFRKLSGTVSKHVAVVSELSRIVNNHQLMGVSETEQDLVTGTDRGKAMANLESVISNPMVRLDDCLRLGLLHTLRYEGISRGDAERIDQLLASRGLSDMDRKFPRALLEYAGSAKRTNELFQNKTTPLSFGKMLFKGLKGVENVYTRHKPLLIETLELLIKGRLKEVQYPYVGNHRQQERPQDIIVFMVGGATYAEAMAIANLNKTTQGVRIILGGTTIHNSKSFLHEVQCTTHTYSRSGRTLA
ncbi:vacuolar protein sorting-associated protein 45-like [Halichondria panicea]|uniref:vacuolar protein sorting-associated protein 45-like n=1 Tax=Halichondria panicea TaxID=6063 RepID=UPI00312B858F